MTHTVWVPSLLTTPWTDLMFIKKFFSKIVRPLWFKTFYKLKKWWNKKNNFIFFLYEKGSMNPGLDYKAWWMSRPKPESVRVRKFLRPSDKIGVWSDFWFGSFFKIRFSVFNLCLVPRISRSHLVIGLFWSSLTVLELRRFAPPHFFIFYPKWLNYRPRRNFISHGTRRLYPPWYQVAVYCQDIYYGFFNACRLKLT